MSEKETIRLIYLLLKDKEYRAAITESHNKGIFKNYLDSLFELAKKQLGWQDQLIEKKLEDIDL
jgi:hypothetical protein